MVWRRTRRRKTEKERRKIAKRSIISSIQQQFIIDCFQFYMCFCKQCLCFCKQEEKKQKKLEEQKRKAEEKKKKEEEKNKKRDPNQRGW